MEEEEEDDEVVVVGGEEEEGPPPLFIVWRGEGWRETLSITTPAIPLSHPLPTPSTGPKPQPDITAAIKSTNEANLNFIGVLLTRVEGDGDVGERWKLGYGRCGG